MYDSILRLVLATESRGPVHSKSHCGSARSVWVAAVGVQRICLQVSRLIVSICRLMVRSDANEAIMQVPHALLWAAES